jgi:hypothetical protein
MIRRRRILVVAASVVLHAQLAAAMVTVEANSTAGTAGQMVEVAVTLAADEHEPVAGVENDLTFDPAATVAVGADARPDCSANTAIRKSATAFGFRPLGCDPRAGQCTGIHALVVAVDNVAPIPSGAVLYRCRVALSAQARPGRYPIGIRNALYAPPSGGDQVAQGSDGAVKALEATGPSAPSTGGGGGGCQTGAAGGLAPLWLAFGLFAYRRWCRARSAP